MMGVVMSEMGAVLSEMGAVIHEVDELIREMGVVMSEMGAVLSEMGAVVCEVGLLIHSIEGEIATTPRRQKKGQRAGLGMTCLRPEAERLRPALSLASWRRGDLSHRAWLRLERLRRRLPLRCPEQDEGDPRQEARGHHGGDDVEDSRICVHSDLLNRGCV